MRVSVEALGPAREPQMRVYRQQMLAMVLQRGWVEVGWQRSQLTRHDYGTGEVILPRRHVQTWARTDTLHYLSIGISDAVLRAVCDDTASVVELRDAPKLDDRRLVGLVAAVNAERIAGFPSGQLFLDSVEQALAVTLVNNHAVRNHNVRVYRGGLGPERMRRIREFVHAAIEDELSLDKMAETVGLSRAHFWQMFRKSTGETPHHFVLRHRVERAKEMLRASEARVLDVAVACGFKTQQHFARIFRQICGTSPTEYRREWLGQKKQKI